MGHNTEVNLVDLTENFFRVYLRIKEEQQTFEKLQDGLKVREIYEMAPVME